MYFCGIVFIIYQAKKTRDKTKVVLLQHAAVQCLWRVDLTSGKADIAAAFFSCGRCVTSIGFAVVPPPSHLRLPSTYQISCLDIVDCVIVFGSPYMYNLVLTGMVLQGLRISMEDIYIGTGCSATGA